VDTAVYSILVGLQLGWDEGKLEKVGVAGLLHDVGYMRLPQNVVKAHWDGRSDAVLLQQHVAIGETLIQRQAPHTTASTLFFRYCADGGRASCLSRRLWVS
jgi:HD-GYP domain-containing protein (c-di-GMP phosphodiesterase class II)